MSKWKKASDKASKTTPKTLISKISSIIIGAIFILVVTAFLSLVVQSMGGKKPSIFGYRVYYVLTASMEPTLSAGDVLLCQLFDDDNEARQRIKEGDIITFVAEYGAQQGMTITHRVVKEVHFDETYGRDVVLTKGDNENASVDPPVPIENVQAILVKESKFFTNMYKFFTSVLGMILIIIIPSLFILTALVWKLVIAAKKPREAEENLAKIEEIKRKAIADYQKELAQKGKEEKERGKNE